MDQAFAPLNSKHIQGSYISGQSEQKTSGTDALNLLPATAQTQQEGPLQRGSHRRWGGSTAWGAHRPGQLGSQPEQPPWHPNILASPREEMSF